MNTNVLFAVFRRNLAAYFASPTGYLFICVFVLLSSVAAFWPYEFFNANLANLDQLNRFFPLIMLIFIPAITMSIWAEERRLGTDELLLTVPAGDFDIVSGKYLAAVAIYSVSLLFSLICNYTVLQYLGNPDFGLFVATYFGYWLVGLAMLAIGMVASFLTDNITVGFILGAVFNAPLVAAVWSDTIVGDTVAREIQSWSIGEQFSDFGRGIISLSGLAYFGAILAVMLYLSMVLIGRRHWARGQDWYVMAGHFAARTVALVLVAISAVWLFNLYDVRVDATSERLSSLSPDTKELLSDLEVDRPVRVEAFISPTVPEAYVQQRVNLLNMLRELEARGGRQVQVTVHDDVDLHSDEALRAEQRYGIEARNVLVTERGQYGDEEIFMGVAMTQGLKKVVIPFIERGIPVEYELVRSLCTVTDQEKKKVGVVRTDARLFGQFNMQTFTPGRNWPIIDELEKMYEVEQVDPTGPIDDEYDVLLAVQPSSLGPEEMEHFVDAIRRGIPTAIFEDPLPLWAGQAPATSQPRRPPQQMMMFGQQQAPPKGDFSEVLRLLGVDLVPDRIIYRLYNPIARLQELPPEFVFVGSTGEQDEFNESEEVSSGLQLMLFPFPGAVAESPTKPDSLHFTPLVETGGGKETGTLQFDDMLRMGPFGPVGLNPYRRRTSTNHSYVLAAHIAGKIENGADDESKDKSDEDAKDDADKDKEGDGDEKKHVEGKLNVIFVSDIDMIHEQFFALRDQGTHPEAGVGFSFDNVTFVLNVLDYLAGDERFIDVRKRRPIHRTLTRVDEQVKEAREKTLKVHDRLQKQLDKAEEEEQEKLDKEMDKLRERMHKEKLDDLEILRRIGIAQGRAEDRMNERISQLKQEQDQERKRIEREEAAQIRAVQDRYKFWAVALPPIPPLVVAVVVFFTRRVREREGVAKSRLR